MKCNRLKVTNIYNGLCKFIYCGDYSLLELQIIVMFYCKNKSYEISKYD